MSLGVRSRLIGVVLCVTWALSLADGLVLAGEADALKAVGNLGVDELLAESEQDAGEPTDASRREAIAERAAALLLANDLWSRGEYGTIRRLVKAAETKLSSLSQEQRGQLEELLAGMASEDAASFEQLQARVALLNAAGKHDAAGVGVVGKWLATRDLRSLDVDQVAWCLAESLPNRSDVNKFAVVWEGAVVAPRSGEYEFSTTPINVNRGGGDFVSHSIVASLGGVEVFRTPQERSVEENEKQSSRTFAQPAAPEWKLVGSTVALTANELTPIRVEVRFEAARPSVSTSAAAILCWKGPGLERQVIAGQALVGPKGESGGLRAEYRWSANGREEKAVQEDAVVDFVWPTLASVAPANPQLVKRLSERLWSLAIREEYLQRCIAGEAAHVYLQSPMAAGLLTSAQRQEFLQLLVARPEFLSKVGDQEMLTLYRGFRFGAEHASIDVLGTWMQQRDSLQPEIVADFFERNRRVYWELGQSLAQQSGGLDRLRDDYLEIDDECCVLPVAYTLSYGYLEADRVEVSDLQRTNVQLPSSHRAWLELLNEYLRNEAIAGSDRINWLLARAQAEEAPAASANTNHLAGRGWLDEASLTVEGDELSQRVERERVARLVGMGLWGDVERALGSDAKFPSTWRTDIDRAKQIVATRQRKDAAEAKRALIADFQRRRQNAVDRDDDVAVAKYEERLRTIASSAE